MADKIRLTPELSQQIVDGISGGAYPHVAAEANGVPKDVFDDWLSRGNQKYAWGPYRSFARDVRKAVAQARLMAEMAGFLKDPKLWLINGPGRESDQKPGWSTSVKPMESTPESRNVLLDRELMQVLRTVMKALEPFPEARAAVAKAVEDAGMPSLAA